VLCDPVAWAFLRPVFVKQPVKNIVPKTQKATTIFGLFGAESTARNVANQTPLKTETACQDGEKLTKPGKSEEPDSI
jgi:hypothetical protein